MSRSRDDGVAQIRQALQLDTWGADLFRVKRRLGEIMQSLKFQDRINEDMAAYVQELGIRVRRLEQAGQTNASPDSSTDA